MDFRTELHIKPWKSPIALSDKIVLMGSCFTEHMAKKLNHYRFNILENPHGILFNPVSIHEALLEYCFNKKYSVNDLFEYNGIWQSWNHHGRFAHLQADECVKSINDSITQANKFFNEANWVIVTLGSAFVYKLIPETAYNNTFFHKVVGNCHRVPAQFFQHSLLSYQEVVLAVQQIIDTAQLINPGIKIIFTISPVRHYREGLVENNRSKSLLNIAVTEALKNNQDHVFYFPAYELIMDDLRDYRFFAEDMVHPNYQATQYVWDKFTHACMDENNRMNLERIGQIAAAMQHRPRQPDSSQHQGFMQKMLKQTELLSAELPFLDFGDALSFFQNKFDAV